MMSDVGLLLDVPLLDYVSPLSGFLSEWSNAIVWMPVALPTCPRIVNVYSDETVV